MKIGIIGCGYVGQAIAAICRKHGYEISATTRHKEKISFLENFVDKVFLLNEHNLSSFLENQDIILITVAPDNPSNYQSTYVNTAKQVKEILKHNSSIKQLIYTSSTSVYGEHNGDWVTEISPLKPESESARLLCETEDILLSCRSQNLNVCIFRLGEIYGPGRLIEDRLERMHNQVFAGTGVSYTNIIHIADIVNAIEIALLNNLDGIFNLCNDFHVPRREFYDQLCQKKNLPVIVWDPEKENRHKGNKRVSNEKIKKEGMVFKHPNVPR